MFKDLFTDSNGVLDDARIAAFTLIVTYCGSALYSLYLDQPWKPQDFGIGAGALAAGVGGWFKLRGTN
jgi:hypothetical protein